MLELIILKVPPSGPEINITVWGSAGCASEKDEPCELHDGKPMIWRSVRVKGSVAVEGLARLLYSEQVRLLYKRDRCINHPEAGGGWSTDRKAPVLVAG